MKKEFSKQWVASKQPRKQRKYLANAPLHLKRKVLSTNLSKALRTKYGTRNVVLRKGDLVKILRGKYAGKQGKVVEIKIKMSKVYVEGIQVKKQDGTKVNVKLQSSNLQIIELNLEDKKRNKMINSQTSETKNKTDKKEVKEVIEDASSKKKEKIKDQIKKTENKK
ncbi:50S ribosomal protein L24 [archaeon]|jgi:large subunit ribosomal protein L24|nr:50S ribosomal protein L24 [archaeon]